MNGMVSFRFIYSSVSHFPILNFISSSVPNQERENREKYKDKSGTPFFGWLVALYLVCTKVKIMEQKETEGRAKASTKWFVLQNEKWKMRNTYINKKIVIFIPEIHPTENIAALFVACTQIKITVSESVRFTCKIRSFFFFSIAVVFVVLLVLLPAMPLHYRLSLRAIDTKAITIFLLFVCPFFFVYYFLKSCIFSSFRHENDEHKNEKNYHHITWHLQYFEICGSANHNQKHRDKRDIKLTLFAFVQAHISSSFRLKGKQKHIHMLSE